jgi:hypothetical protein
MAVSAALTWQAMPGGGDRVGDGARRGRCEWRHPGRAAATRPRRVPAMQARTRRSGRKRGTDASKRASGRCTRL